MQSKKSDEVDLGHGHRLKFVCWKPDRRLNPQYADIPDVERAGAIVSHLTEDGQECSGIVYFDLASVRQLFPHDLYWVVECWEPLTLSPSIRCSICGDHGFVRDGRWVSA